MNEISYLMHPYCNFDIFSESTKKKISENNKKFSICKLCGSHCKGFRGQPYYIFLSFFGKIPAVE